MSTATDAVKGREVGQNMTPNTGEGSGETLRKDLRCSGCAGILPAGTPIRTLAWDRESRRFKHSPSCMAQDRSGHEAERPSSVESAPLPGPNAHRSAQHSKEAPSPPPRPTGSAHESSGEPGPEAGGDWARIGFTLRLAEYESLRAEVALYAVIGESDAKFTERLRESLLIKAQEALAAVEETREMVRGRART